MRILVVEDDPVISILIETILERSNYAIDFATDGQMGLDLNEAYEYDALLLDVSLPKLDGITVCRQIRAAGNTVPILLLTAIDSPADRARGLDAGADDYLGKPFDPDELLARVRALLRRSHQPSAPILTWGQLQLDPAGATVTYHDRLIPVTAKEYALLELFLRNSKRIFSCDAILDHIWAYDDAPSAEAIRTHIKGLRHKLKAAGAASDFIETVYGIGYRLKPLNTPATDAIAATWAQFNDRILDRIMQAIDLAIEKVESSQTQILIVDDDLKVLTILRALLIPWGFRVTTLAEAQRFWEIFPVVKPDLLILDVEMPQVSGLELCQAVREQTDRSQLPIVFLTAHTEPNLVREVFASGADDFVAKPVAGAEIIARISNLLARQHWREMKRQLIANGAIDLATTSKIRTELIEIESALVEEKERHDRTIDRLSTRLSLLHQLLVDF